MNDMSQTAGVPEIAGDPQTSGAPRASSTPLIPVITQNELVSIFTAHKSVALQDFARDRRKVRVDAVVRDNALSDQAGTDIYAIEQFTGKLQMVTGQSLMLETISSPVGMGTEADYRHPVIALNEVLDVILLN